MTGPGTRGALVRLLAGAAASVVVVALALALAVVVEDDPVRGREDQPPPARGYVDTMPPGSWRDLPGDRSCAGRVHRSSWEPRPENYRANHRMPDRDRVRRAFEARPRARQGAYAPRWDSWLLRRVSGQFVGTTDEILQWAACKWGISDNVLRAVAERESGWFQHQVYADGSCVVGSGCGDMFPQGSPAARVFCRTVARHSPEDRHRNRAQWQDCPRTFSIVGVMSWHDPRWGRLAGNQNGTYPFNVRSTAFAVDYLGSFLRGCLEGWVRWLGNTGRYRSGDLGGCLGAWYAGAWKSPDAREYTSRVREALADRIWLEGAWFRRALPCEPDRGCPRAAP